MRKHVKKHTTMATVMAAGALTLGTVLVAGPASATTPGATTPTVPKDLGAERARCTTMIDVRLAELTKLDAALQRAKRITDDHRDAQRASDAAAAAGLGALRTKIAGDTDRTTLTADCRMIVDGYRVFALRAPQTHLVIGGDAVAVAISTLDTTVPKLAAAIERAAAAGEDVAAARTALADLQTKLDDATARSAGVADGVLGMTPADYNANHALLDGARASIAVAVADVHAARADVTTITTALKG